MQMLPFGPRRCYDPVTLMMAAATAVSVGTSVYGGIQSNKAAKEEAAMQAQQGELAYQEAQVSATNEAFNQTQSVQRQKLAFLSSGVSLEGSPLMVLDQSRQYGQSQVDAILRQGSAQKSLADQEAKITKNKGRAALVSGIGSGISKAIGGGVDMNKAGAFDSKPVTSK